MHAGRSPERGEAINNEIVKLKEETKLFLERCIALLDEKYVVKYDERFWEE